MDVIRDVHRVALHGIRELKAAFSCLKCGFSFKRWRTVLYSKCLGGNRRGRVEVVLEVSFNVVSFNVVFKTKIILL